MTQTELTLFPSAEIIPFPAKPTLPAQFPDAQSEEPMPRLCRALATLQAAQAEQLRALTAWRASLAKLSATASGLQTSLHTYRQALDTIRTP